MRNLSPFRILPIVVGSVCFCLPAAHAGIMVNSGDVVAGEYVYEFGYNNYNRGWNDAETKINFSYMTWFDPVGFTFALNGQSHAQLVLHWDFSSSGLLPNTVELKDRTTLFTNTSVERTQAVVEYSTTGTSWQTIDIQTTPTSGSVVNDNWTNTILNLGSGAGHFYYRLTMNTIAGDADGKFSNNQNQWARANPGVTSFRAAFSAAPIPEPGTLALLLFGGLGLAFRATRRGFGREFLAGKGD
ncbi:MAG: PEP-CTERM sorting domain-containing protein [Pirellulales bacterium]|nr:PEP-CTERM sorting domain-containing protein [Pirellulales bacterium]